LWENQKQTQNENSFFHPLHFILSFKAEDAVVLGN